MAADAGTHADVRTPGQDALAAFARDHGVASPRAAMRAACARLRRRVSEVGWRPGLDAYLRAFGLSVLETPIPTAGRLDYEDGRYVIRVQRAAEGDAPRPPTPLRPADATGRQRFSIAHEIGHALLLESLGRQPEHLPGLHDASIWPELERLCDLAAAELLVPLDDFLKAAGQVGCSPRAIERLAEGVRVSSDVILLRLLAAGARSVSLWQVRPSPDGQEAVSATVVRAFRSGRAPDLDPGTTSSVLRPDVVLRVACGGRAHVSSVEVMVGDAARQFAAVVDGGSLKASPFEPVQLRWLDDEQMPADQPAPISTGRIGLDAQVTLLLLPERAAAEAAPLWVACVPRPLPS